MENNRYIKYIRKLKKNSRQRFGTINIYCMKAREI